MPAADKISTRLLRAELIRQFEKGLDRGAIFLSNEMKQGFGFSGVSGGRSGATRQTRRQNRSKPGEPPNVDTGHYRRNITHGKPRPLTRRVGTGVGNLASVPYAIYLERGTDKMEARPLMMPTLIKNKLLLRIKTFKGIRI